jgi:hypothetical protein
MLTSDLPPEDAKTIADLFEPRERPVGGQTANGLQTSYLLLPVSGHHRAA